MYNRDQKESFISAGNIKEKPCYLFQKISEYEKALDKDISLFTKEEVVNMFKDMEITSNAIVNNYIAILGAYVHFVNAEDKTDHTNVFKMLDRKERKELIDTKALRSKFLTKEEIMEMCSLKKDTTAPKIENPQVAAIVGLIWSGVPYKNKCEQLLNASTGQFNASDDLFEFENNGEKIILSLERWVSKILIDIFLNERYYIVRSKKDGTLSKREVPLSSGYKYLFRKIRSKDAYSSDVPISYVALHYRFKTEMKHLNRTAVTFKSIADSKVLHEYHQLEDKSLDQLKYLIKRYGHTEPTGLAIQYYKQGYKSVYGTN